MSISVDPFVAIPVLIASMIGWSIEHSLLEAPWRRAGIRDGAVVP